jgi:hypothetical protein
LNQRQGNYGNILVWRTNKIGSGCLAALIDMTISDIRIPQTQGLQSSFLVVHC